MQCRLCEEFRPLVKAHVIPEAFFRPLRTRDEAPVLATNTRGIRPARAPIGVYDRTILCRDCERLFDQVDSYGAATLLSKFDQLFQPLHRNERLVAYQSSAVDQPLLLRFLLSVLWRASVSTHRFYARVKLGPYETQLRSLIVDSSAPIPQCFGAVLSRWTSTKAKASLATTVMDPFRERWNGVNAYRLYFGETVAYLRVDHRQFPQPLSSCALLARSDLQVFTRDIGASNDFQALINTVSRPQHRVR